MSNSERNVGPVDAMLRCLTCWEQVSGRGEWRTGDQQEECRVYSDTDETSWCLLWIWFPLSLSCGKKKFFCGLSGGD